MAAAICLTGMGVNCVWCNVNDMFVVVIVVSFRVGFAKACFVDNIYRKGF